MIKPILNYNEKIHNKALKRIKAMTYREDCEKAGICMKCGNDLEDYDVPGKNILETRCKKCHHVAYIN